MFYLLVLDYQVLKKQLPANNMLLAGNCSTLACYRSQL